METVYTNKTREVLLWLCWIINCHRHTNQMLQHSCCFVKFDQHVQNGNLERKQHLVTHTRLQITTCNALHRPQCHEQCTCKDFSLSLCKQFTKMATSKWHHDVYWFFETSESWRNDFDFDMFLLGLVCCSALVTRPSRMNVILVLQGNGSSQSKPAGV